METLRNAPAAEPLLASYLGKNGADGAFKQTQLMRDSLLNQMQALLIEPLCKLYENDIKAAESKKKQFEEESKDYYGFLSKYLAQKADSGKIKKKLETESKYQSKRKSFDLVRFDYYAFMQDLHGGRKEQEVLHYLASYFEKQYVFYQSVAQSISDLKPGLDQLAQNVADSTREMHIIRKEREERRRALETRPTTVNPVQMEIFPEANSLIGIKDAEFGPDGLALGEGAVGLNIAGSTESGAGPSTQDQTGGQSKFKGIRDLEHQDPEILSNLGRRKEGFLFATSRPSKNSATFDVGPNPLWHKCVFGLGISSGFLLVV